MCGAMAVGYTKDAKGNLKMSREWHRHLVTMKALADAGKSSWQIATEMKREGCINPEKAVA